MARDLRERVERLREEGYSDRAIRERLVEDGVHESIVDGLVDPGGARPLTAVQRVARYGWLAVFVIAVFLYLAIALAPIRLFILGTTPFIVVGVLLGLFLVLSTLAGVHWLLHGYRRVGSAGLFGGVLLIGASAWAVVRITAVAGSAGLESAVASQLLSGPSAVTALPTVWLVGAGLVNTGLWRERRLLAFLPLAIAVMVVGGVYAFQTAAVPVHSDMQDPALNVLDPGSTPELSREAAHAPPPFGKIRLFTVFISDASGALVRWQDMLQEAGAAAEGCGLTGQQGGSPREALVVTAAWQEWLVDMLAAHNATLTERLEQACRQRASCSASAAAIEDDFRTYYRHRENWVNGVQSAFGIPQKRIDTMTAGCR